MIRAVLILPFMLSFNVFAQDVKDDVSTLIRQLGSAKYAEREMATRALEKLGAKALGHLQKALDERPEVSRRAKALIDKIQERTLQDAVRKPRVVRWEVEKDFALPVLEKAQKDWGVSVYLKTNREELAQRPMTLKTGELPFWEAWEKLLHKAGLVELVAAPSLGPAQPPPFPGGQLSFRSYSYTKEPHARWLTSDGLQETPVLIQETAPACPTDRSGAVRVRGMPLTSTGTPLLLLEIRPQPGLGWLALEKVALEHVMMPGGKAVAISEDLQAMHDATARKTAMNWSHLLEHASRRDVPSWPCDTMILELPGEAKEWTEVRGHLRARVYHAHVELCLDAATLQEGKTWKSTSGVRGKVTERRVADDGTLNLRLHLEEHDAWVAEYPGPTVRRVRPGVAAFVGPGDIAADLLQVLDSKGKSLPRIHVSASTADDGKGLNLELSYQAPLGGDEDYRLVALRYFASSVEFPFTLRRTLTAPKK